MPRAHLAALLAASACAGALGVTGTVIVTAVSERRSADGLVDVAPLSAGGAGLLVALVCLVTGAAVGTLCSRPLLRGRGWSLASTALLALVTTGSPAKAAVSGLVTGSRTGVIHTPGLPLAVAGAVCVWAPGEAERAVQYARRYGRHGRRTDRRRDGGVRRLRALRGADRVPGIGQGQHAVPRLRMA